MLDQASALAENINATLMTVVYFIATNGRVTIGRDPDTGEIIRMYTIVDKLSQAIFVHVYSASLAVMNFATYDGWIRSCFHFESGNSIIMNIVMFEIPLFFFFLKT